MSKMIKYDIGMSLLDFDLEAKCVSFSQKTITNKNY